MIGLAAAGAQQVTRRFILVSWIPSALLLLLVFGLYWADGTTGQCLDKPCLDRAVDIATDSYGIRIALLVVAAFIASLVLHPLQLGLVRFLEGYWDGWTVGRTIAGWLISRHSARRRRLERATRIDPHLGQAERHRRLREVSSATSQLAGYPAPSRVLPTTLGNTLRSAEDAAGSRYGLDAVLVWPRLYAVLADRPLGILNNQRMQLDIAAQFCVSLMLGSLLSFWMLLPDGIWMLLPLALLTLAWLSYRAAVAVARAYGAMMATAVDLHRFDVLQALHVPLPQDFAKEHEVNEELCRVLADGRPVSKEAFRYEHAQAGQIETNGDEPSSPGASPS